MWALYVFSEFLANMIHYRPWQREQLLRDIALYLPVIMLATYVIALILVPRYLSRGRNGIFAIYVLGVAVMLYFGRIYWVALLSYLDHGEWATFPAPKVLKNVIRDYAVVGFAVCLQIIADWRWQSRRNQQLQVHQDQLALKLLKAQLHPHFLFNTLNNLYGLALREAPETPDGILRLSSLLDYLLYTSDKAYVSLPQELEMLDHYLQLERLRYGDDLRCEWEYKEESGTNLGQWGIAPLLLLPLLENAFKHGAKTRDGVMILDIQLAVERAWLSYRISNSCGGPASQNAVPGGIGLDNLRQRLELLYPGQYELIIQAEEDRFTVDLQVALTAS